MPKEKITKNNSKRNKLFITIGLLFIAAGILFRAVNLPINPDGITRPAINKTIIWSIKVFFISTGFLFIRYKSKNIAILLATLIICFIITEIGYRIFDPFPFIDRWEINHTEHGNLLQYDETLGWSGLPNAKAQFITENNKILIQHNQSGFRDIEHEKDQTKKEAIVFLGDSFTWGYQVNFDQMFVNILRKKLTKYEIFNLAHRGYGTDQSLLAFKRWHFGGSLKSVILMFSETDPGENIRLRAYSKFKPKYELRGDDLVLTNVPVPRTKEWQEAEKEKKRKVKKPSLSLPQFLHYSLFKSHFIHDINFRLNLRILKKNRPKTQPQPANQPQMAKEEYILTKRIIQQLRDLVVKRGGDFIIIAIPSKQQFMRNSSYTPYQWEIEKMCKDLDIDYFDLAPYFKKSFFRTYYRNGSHWNKFGDKVAAKAIYNYLKNKKNI